MSLNERQKKFCEFYAKTGNAVQSYKDAGYDVKSDAGARASSSKLLTNPNIAEFISDLHHNTRSEAIADITEVKEFWTNTFRGKEDCDYKDRLKASELLAKSAGAFIDKVEHSGSLQIQKIEREIIYTKD